MNWFQRLFRRKEMEEQLEKEVRFHLEQQEREFIAQGYSSQEAHRQALLILGGSEQVKEDCRDARGTRWVEDFFRDLRFAIRALRKQPGFAAIGLLTLALGTGATTVMFTVFNGVLLKPLPYPDAGRLLSVHGHSDSRNAAVYGEQNVAYPDLLDCQRQSRTMDMSGFLYNNGIVGEPGTPEYADLREITPLFFSVLGIQLAQGRGFLPEEDYAGATPVVILGHSLWLRRFGGNPNLVGQSIVLDDKNYTVVGIAPAGFRPGGDEPDVMTPLGQDTQAFLKNRKAHPINVQARLRPGVTLSEARSELALLGRQLEQQYPDSNTGRSLVAGILRADVGDVRATLWLLLGAVALVLLIACVNVASLMLARAVSRDRELAMRVALGASRGRLVRQCLTESGVLGLCGGVLGVFVAAVGFRPFVQLWPGVLPRAEEVQLDWRVLLFALAVSLLSGLLFGLAPALRAPAMEVEQTLRSGGRTLAGGSRRLHSSFVISEIALAVVLLVAAGMLGRTLLRLSALSPGVSTHNILVARLALSPAVLSNPATARAAWQDILDRGRRIPGVESIAAVDTFPMREGDNQVGYSNSANIPPENQQPLALATSVTPEYLNVMGLQLIEGRFFDDHDRRGSEPVIVIDEVFAQQAFGKEDPVGKPLWIPSMSGPDWTSTKDPMRVVGIVGHVRHWGLARDDQAPVRAQFYYPFAQVPDVAVRRWSELMSIAVRTKVPPLTLVESLRHELRGATAGATGDQALYQVRTMEQLASDSLARQRFLLLLFGIFAGVALLLACIGIYGVLAYLTGQRVPEFGVRIALGASARSVIQLVLRQSLGMIVAGLCVGVLAAVAAGKVMVHLVDGMQSVELSTFAITIPLLVVAALLASYVPALRASRIDPIRALRQD
jgi:predicted permease